MLKKLLKNEKGAITLFVLLAILFFLIVIFSLLMTSSNNSRVQTSEIDKIKQEYQESVDNIDQIYQDTLADNLLDLIQVGDYVNYTYDTVSNGYNLLASQSGYDSNQTIAQTSGLKWRILNIDEDGTVDLISDTPTDQDVYFRGALGYNNGVLLLNDMCKQLYSNSSLGIEARSINIEDIENQMSAAGIAAKNAYISMDNELEYGKTKTYTGTTANYPLLYAKENGSGINTTTTKTDGISQNENGYSTPTTETSALAEEGLTITQTYYGFSSPPSSYFNNNEAYDMLFNTQDNYWLATRFSDAYPDSIRFGLHFINISNLGGNNLFGSSDFAGNYCYHLRPIISLNINQILPCVGDNSESNMHQIRQ